MKRVRLGLYIALWVLSLLVFSIAAARGCKDHLDTRLAGCRPEAKSAVFAGVVAWLISFGLTVVYFLEALGRMEFSYILRRTELCIHSALVFIWFVCSLYTAATGPGSSYKSAVATFGFFALFDVIALLTLVALYVDDYN